MNDTTETPDTDAAWAAERLSDGRTRGERRADNRAKARFVLAFGSCLSPSPRVRTEGARLMDEIRRGRAMQSTPNS